jgi:hypothetical protein
MALPRYPVPPVTSTRMRVFFLVLPAGQPASA